VASKLHQDEIERGDEFLVTISAYGQMELAHIQLRCWTRDQKFHVEEVKPTKQLTSDIQGSQNQAAS
jgi:hypothetical protein